MARPREFDEAAVLDAAIRRFWLCGYEATSVRDLAEEMGIGSASLYNAFGDKRTLYRSSLNRYLEQTFRERIRRLERSLPPREAIMAFLREIVERSLTDKRQRGCMLVNSTLENVPEDRDFQQIVATFLGEVESFFLRCAAAGQREGSISNSQSAEDFARLFLGVLLGIRVLARVRPDAELLEGMLRPIFAMLDESSSKPRAPKRRLASGKADKR